MSILGDDDSDSNDPNAVYVQPNVELKLDANKRRECRDIVREIVSFGVSQRQILFVIQLLTLELENREIMTKILGVIGQTRDEVPVGTIFVPKSGDIE